MTRSLKQQGVNFTFGAVGFPVGPIAAAAQKAGIASVGMPNRQSASGATRSRRGRLHLPRRQICV